MRAVISGARILLLVIALAPLAHAQRQQAATISAHTREALQARQGQQCRSMETSEAPFYVTSSPENRNYAAVSARAGRSEVAGYIPRNSVVKLTSPESVVNLDILGNDFVGIQVVSVPNVRTDENARRSPTEIRSAVVGAGTRAVVGFRGAVQRRHLKPAGQSTFIVERDAPALQIPGGEYAIAGKPMRLATVAGVIGEPRYRVNRCCNARPREGGILPSAGEIQTALRDVFTTATGGMPEGCHDNYIFEVMNPQLTCIERSVELAAPNCDRMSANLRPIPNDQFEAVYTLSRITGRGPESMEYIDSSGLYKLPKDPATGLRPFNGLNAWRNPSSEREPPNDANVNFDSFMDPLSACAYMRVLQAFQRECGEAPGCQVQDNDAYHPNSWNGHRSHGKKTCIDIFPISTNTRGPGSVRHTSPNYDRARTMRLIELLIEAGAERSQLGYSDPTAVRRFRTQPWAGHDNHIHVCFPTGALNAETPMVRRACRDGVGTIRTEVNSNRNTQSTLLDPSIGQAAGEAMFGFVAPRCN